MHAFDVLGDPVRRRILELLLGGRTRGRDIGAVVQAEFGISQPAVSQHLRVLASTVRDRSAQACAGSTPWTRPPCRRSTAGWMPTATLGRAPRRTRNRACAREGAHAARNHPQERRQPLMTTDLATRPPSLPATTWSDWLYDASRSTSSTPGRPRSACCAGSARISTRLSPTTSTSAPAADSSSACAGRTARKRSPEAIRRDRAAGADRDDDRIEHEGAVLFEALQTVTFTERGDQTELTLEHRVTRNEGFPGAAGAERAGGRRSTSWVVSRRASRRGRLMRRSS